MRVALPVCGLPPGLKQSPCHDGDSLPALSLAACDAGGGILARRFLDARQVVVAPWRKRCGQADVGWRNYMDPRKTPANADEQPGLPAKRFEGATSERCHVTATRNSEQPAFRPATSNHATCPHMAGKRRRPCNDPVPTVARRHAGLVGQANASSRLDGRIAVSAVTAWSSPPPSSSAAPPPWRGDEEPSPPCWPTSAWPSDRPCCANI